MDVPLPTQEPTVSDTVRMERPARQRPPDSVIVEEPTVVQPVLPSPPTPPPGSD